MNKKDYFTEAVMKPLGAGFFEAPTCECKKEIISEHFCYEHGSTGEELHVHANGYRHSKRKCSACGAETRIRWRELDMTKLGTAKQTGVEPE